MPQIPAGGANDVYGPTTAQLETQALLLCLTTKDGARARQGPVPAREVGWGEGGGERGGGSLFAVRVLITSYCSGVYPSDLSLQSPVEESTFR